MNIKSKKGFTIIEVVLVLAIAGLIFLMVFIALPNMQRSQRDTQRRNDFSAFSAAMTSYMTNNNGSLPAKFLRGTATSPQDAAKYVNSTGLDPNGFAYLLYVYTCTENGADATKNCKANNESGTSTTATTLTNATADASTKIYLFKNAGCDNGRVVYKKSSRAFAVYGNLEAGNGTYCSASS